jgi:outer membrane protein assembly factor BamB
MRATFTVLFLSTLLFCSPATSRAAGGQVSTAGNGLWTILEIHQVNPYVSGLAWDGNYFYTGSYSNTYGTEIHRFDPETGTSQLLFHGPQKRTFGLTWDGSYLWLIDREMPTSTPAFAMQIDLDGNLVSQFDLSHYYMSGIAWDNGNFWVGKQSPNPGEIFHIDGNGQILSSFVAPENDPWDVALDGDYLWIAESAGGKIHKTDLQGNLLESHPSITARATGVMRVGQHIWYVARQLNGVSYIYKVDPDGPGTPGIQVDASMDFGQQLINTSESKNLLISNNGTGPLIIDALTVEDDNQVFSVNANLPITIEPESSVQIPVFFSPDTIGDFSGTLIIQSNDPASTQKFVQLSGIGLEAGPYLVTDASLIDFETVRLNSSSLEKLILRNMGNIRVQIQSITFTSEDYYLHSTVNLPLNIYPAEKKELPFWFNPSAAGQTDAEAIIAFNNPDQSPLTVSLKGFAEDRDYAIGETLWYYEMTWNPDNARAILTVPDVTGDGHDDVIVSTRGENIYCFAGNSSGEASMVWEAWIGVVEYPKAIALMDDINEDGYQDFVAGTAWGDRAINAVSSKTGEIIWRYETNQYGSGGWVYMVDVKYDYNNNGYRDVLAATGTDGDGGGPRRVFLLNGKTGDVIWSTFLNEAAFSVLAVEDFTGDGIPDVVAGATTSYQQGRVVGINGANGNIEWSFTTSGTSVWALEQTGDLTGNGIRDIIAGSYNGWYYLMDVTNGNVINSGTLGNALILDFWNAGDLNGDGYDDFVPAYTSIHNAVAISGKTGQLLWSTPIADQSWSVAPMSDITGDGVNDIAIGTLYTNNRVYFLSGATGEIIDWVPMRAPVDVLTPMADVTGDNSMEVVAGTRDKFVIALSGGTAVAPQPFDVTFIVTDDSTPPAPIENAVVVITESGKSATTDSSGQAVIDLGEGTFNYTVSKDGYHSAQGTFQVVDQDISIEVTLSTDDTSVPDLIDPMVAGLYNYPNPFSDYTNIVFTLTREAPVTIMFYDMNGRRFSVIENQMFGAGENVIQWDGRDASGNLLHDGMYFIELHTYDRISRHKMLILRN